VDLPAGTSITVAVTDSTGDIKYGPFYGRTISKAATATLLKSLSPKVPKLPVHPALGRGMPQPPERRPWQQEQDGPSRIFNPNIAELNVVFRLTSSSDDAPSSVVPPGSGIQVNSAAPTNSLGSNAAANNESSSGSRLTTSLAGLAACAVLAFACL
jgi:hypothetical protein